MQNKRFENNGLVRNSKRFLSIANTHTIQKTTLYMLRIYNAIWLEGKYLARTGKKNQFNGSTGAMKSKSISIITRTSTLRILPYEAMCVRSRSKWRWTELRSCRESEKKKKNDKSVVVFLRARGTEFGNLTILRARENRIIVGAYLGFRGHHSRENQAVWINDIYYVYIVCERAHVFVCVCVCACVCGWRGSD